MLLQALHKYAEQRKLLDRMTFETRKVHLLIPLNADGSVRGNGFVSQPSDDDPKKTGRNVLLPSFPGENNGGKAYYLAESACCILGVQVLTGLPVVIAEEKNNPTKSFNHFWARIQDAADRTKDTRLRTLLAFRDRYLIPVNGSVPLFPWLNWRVNASSRADEPKPEWHGRMENGNWVPIAKSGTTAFEIGDPLFVPTEGWRDDPIWQDWATTYRSEAFTESEEDDGSANASQLETVCLVTGKLGLPIARSHNPKIKGVGYKSGSGRLVSFADASPAFSSFGFKMGANAPVSEAAAANYSIALTELLNSEDTHFDLDELSFCFWADEKPAVATANGRLIAKARPSVVRDFLKSPFAGVPREVFKKVRYFSVSLISVNKARIAVKDWLCLPLDEAIEHFKKWFEELDVAPLVEKTSDDGERSGPYSLRRLAYALLPKANGEKSDSSRAKVRNRIILELYTKAIDGTAVSLSLLPRLLEEYVTALITDSPKQNKPTYPLGRSRFALLKLILIRNHDPSKGEFMPRVHLATDTSDQAYNLGRLLAILARVQKKAHEERKNGKVVKKLEGPGIVQRYYGGASTSPRTIFPVLFKLNMHHLRKLEQNGDGGVRTAEGFRAKIGDVLKLIPKDPSGDPDLKAVLDLKDQARFALGYYQQHAYDRVASHVGHKLGEARKALNNKDAQLVELCLDQAKQAVTLDDYPDLFHRVNNFKLEPNQE